MLAKLFKGELSLGATFWKFGVLVLIVLYYALKLFASLLAPYLQGRTLYNFFMHHFHIIYTPKLSLWWALCYVATWFILILYSYKIIVAVWRSSQNYDKSIWLRQLSRLGILLAIFMVWYSILHPFLTK
jgi:hypothetical protein